MARALYAATASQFDPLTVRFRKSDRLVRVDDCQSPVPAEWPHPSGVQPVVLRFRVPETAPRDLGAKRYQGRFSLRGSTCKGPRARLRPANFPLPRRPADAFAGT